MKLEVGKWYRDEMGRNVKIVDKINQGGWPYRDAYFNGFTEDGFYIDKYTHNPKDLIEEIYMEPLTEENGYIGFEEGGTNPKDLIGSTKPPISLIPPSGLVHIASAMKNGADKYGAYNWRDNKVQMMIYLDAMLRHILALIDGENVAEDSQQLHLAHIGANACILMDAVESGNLIDNRPTKGNANQVIKRLTKTKQ